MSFAHHHVQEKKLHFNGEKQNDNTIPFLVNRQYYHILEMGKSMYQKKKKKGKWEKKYVLFFVKLTQCHEPFLVNALRISMY